MRFGIREICEVVLRAKATQYLGNKKFYKNEPVLYFDSLKTSSLEGAATTVYATGGRGNTRLVAWEGERTLTFTMEDALISPESFAILSGAGLIDVNKNKPIYVHTTSQLILDKDNTIVLPEEACWNKCDNKDEYYHNAADIFIMELKDGQIAAEPCIPAALDADHKTITCYGHNGKLAQGTVVIVDYYVKRTGGAQLIEITADKFGGNYYLEASTLFRDEQSGVDMPAEFIIPNCKVQSNFTFSMAATGDPSTFTFTMDAFPDYVKFDQTHKVLAAIQVITEALGNEEDDIRQPCEPGEDNGSDEPSQDTDAFVQEASVAGANVAINDHGTSVQLTVTGVNLTPTYDKDTFGTLPANVKGTELKFNVPVETVRVKQVNPALENFSDDPTVKLVNGAWTKDKNGYDFTGADNQYQMIITDKSNNAKVELYDASDKLIKTYTVKVNVTFAA